MRPVRDLLVLVVFLAFVIIASRHTSQGPALPATPENVLKNNVVPPPSVKSARDIALGLPDSLLPFCRGLSSDREIALSFDACPTSGKNHFNRSIAMTLISTRTPATIFLSGRWVQQDTAATRLLASDSLIEFGNHSFSHPHMTRIPEQDVKRELERTQQIITSLTGKTPFLFRAPYGEYNDSLIHTAREIGLATVQFSVESGDPDTTFTATKLIGWVTKEARNGSVVIMHINNRGWHTAQALPRIIKDLREKGYKLVNVSDLMREYLESFEPRTASSSSAATEKIGQ